MGAPLIWNIALRFTVGLLVKGLYPARVKNRWRLPRRGPYILAIGPHTNELESAAASAAILRHCIRFYAKAEYWDKSKKTAWFMNAARQIPLPRTDPRKADAAIDLGAQCLADGDILAIWPEGTRNRLKDDLVHRGHTGLIRTALRASELLKKDVLIVPVGLVDFDDILPPGHGYKWRIRTMTVGEPIHLSDHKTAVEEHLKGKALEYSMGTRMMEHVMEEIAHLSSRGYSKDTLKRHDE